MTASTIRVFTWNIHGAIGPDRRYDLERVIALVRLHKPDIIALQEVDSRGRNGNSPFQRLVATLGTHSAEARTITAPDGEYGHMLISRWPMAQPILHDLSMDRREPRLAIETTIETPLGRLHTIAAHFGLGFSERRRQTSILNAIRCPSDAPLSMMLGDFNDWHWRGPVRRILAGSLPSHTGHMTFPAWAPLLKLDRIYCGGEAQVRRSWTDRGARRASDHLPVIADIGRGSASEL
ncbi:MAG: endonuclease/exonuclease/phosphatase family protein [Alphaproteobacteria bacterium]|nr:endonuclease/exonuclease/phosphatase family protein [Alphaproteobacteria bacterium]MBU0798756.1 endonuclease/exonuclease/phosphatase family protein [Alphaproteobacteria bacterium]MBU0886019.1 endonuclease/exonuclease/phosphatase family protein [Alphaproteobacteria bacterium]MBU1812008.1 endonuclease/exonuclease/phosphatase family protein [Alphaproteobacteria bacterium]